MLDSTVSGAAANSYLSLDEADERINEFPNADRWDEIDDTDQERLLLKGTRLIDRYKSWPPGRQTGQRLVFPSSLDPSAAIPEGVKLALLEFIDATLDGSLDALKKLQAEGVSNASILGQSASIEGDESLLTVGVRRELDKIWDGYNAPRVGKRAYDGSTDKDCEALFG